MTQGRITVFGGSGFLGRRIVLRLAGDGAEVRLAVRHPERAAFLSGAGTGLRISAIRADVWEPGVGRRGGRRRGRRGQHGRALRRAQRGEF